MFASADAEWSQILDVSTDYSAIVNLAGCPGFSGDLDTLSSQTKDRIRSLIDFYRTNIKFLSRCVCHLLTKPERIDCINGWAVMQYENIDGEGSIIYAYRLNADVDMFIAYPKNLDPGCGYRIERVGMEEEIRTGKSLLVEGLEIFCGEYYDAAMVKIEMEK